MTMLEKINLVRNTPLAEIPSKVRWLIIIPQQIVLFAFIICLNSNLITFIVVYTLVFGLTYWLACEIHWKIQRSKQEQDEAP